MIFSHNNGGADNVHFAANRFIEIDENCSIDPVFDHNSHSLKTVKEFRDHSLVYGHNNSYVHRFPPREDMKSSCVKNLGDMLEDDIKCNFFGDKEKVMMLTGYNCFQHLELFKILPRNISEDQYDRCQNTVTLISWDLGILAVFTVCESNDPSKVKASVALSNIILNSLYTLFHKRIKDAKVALYAAVYLPEVDRSTLDQSSYSFLNGDFSTTQAKESMIFVAKHEQPNLVLINDILNKSRDSSQSSASTNLKEISFEMMSIMALSDEALPNLCGDANERISSLLFNQQQWEIVNSLHPLKVIEACYGSGKTLVLKRIAQNHFLHLDRGSVHYICFDPYSLLDVHVHQDFQKMKEKKISSRVELTSVNLKDLAKRLNINVNDMFHSTSKPIFPLSKILETFPTDPHPKTFLIDEYPGRYLESDLKIPVGTNVVIALQSIKNDVTVYGNDETHVQENLASQTPPPKDFKIFKLTKSMRMCADLFHLVKIGIGCIKPSVISLDKLQKPIAIAEESNHATITESADQFESLTSDISSSPETNVQAEDSTDGKSQGPANEKQKSEDQSDSTINRPSMSTFDPATFPDWISGYSHGTSNGSKVVVTPHLDKESKSGTTIQSGVKPQLIYLPEMFQFCQESGDLLAEILKSLCSITKATTIICSSLGEIVITKYALQTLGKKVAVYTPYLYRKFPSMAVKEVIMTEVWKNGYFLLTDYRSFR